VKCEKEILCTIRLQLYDLYGGPSATPQLCNLFLIQIFLCFPPPSVITYKYNTSVSNTTLYFYIIKWYICQGDMFRPVSVNPEALQVNKSKSCLSFLCSVGTQMLTSFCYRNVNCISLYILNWLCDGFSLEILETYQIWQYIVPLCIRDCIEI